MKNNHQLLVLGLVAMACTVSGAEKKISIKEAPPAVRAAIEKQAKGGTIIDVDVEEVDGKKVYTSEIHKNGEEFDVQVTGDGKLIGAQPGNPAGKTDVEKSPQHGSGKGAAPKADAEFSQSFFEDKKDLVSTGRNSFWFLEPGHTCYYEGIEDGKKTNLIVKVLAETKNVDGVETRIVEERESVEGKVVEVSRNYFAFSKRTGNVYYFGESVDMYKDGQVTGHEGSWEAGVNGAHYGLFMPATPILGSRYFQEIAPKVAMDRVENVSLSEVLSVPAGKFTNVLKTEETTPLEPGNKEYKYYAEGKGLIKDGDLGLVRVEESGSGPAPPGQ